MRLVSHPNIVHLMCFFYSKGEQVRDELRRSPAMAVASGTNGHSARSTQALVTAYQDEVYLNLVLEYIPETIHRGIRNFARLKQTMPMLHVKVHVGAGPTVPTSCLCRVADVARRGVRFTSPVSRSSTCTSCSARWRTSTSWASAIGISNRRTCCWTLRQECSSSATLAGALAGAAVHEFPPRHAFLG